MKRIFTILVTTLIILALCLGCNKHTIIPEPDNGTNQDINTTSQAITTISESSISQESSVIPESPSYPESYMITTDNYIDYQPGLECSAFSSAYLLRHYGEEANGLELYKTFPGRLSGGGAMPNGITEFFTERGYKAEFKSDGTVDILKEKISLGNPVIVFIHVKEPYKSPHNTHYIPLIGYDEDYFYFAESLADYANCKDEENAPYNRKTEISKFERLWSNIDATWDYPYFVITVDD